MPPADPHTIRLTTVCVYSLCLGYRTTVPPHHDVLPDAPPDRSSSFIVLSAAFLILFFVAVLVLVLWELFRHAYPSLLRAARQRHAGGLLGAADDDDDDDDDDDQASVCAVVTTDGANVLSLYEHLDCVSPLCVMDERRHRARDKCECGPGDDGDDCADDGRDATCAICLDDVCGGDIARRLSCGHRFHARCMDRWFLQEAVRSRTHKGCVTVRCPLCAAHVVAVPVGTSR